MSIHIELYNRVAENEQSQNPLVDVIISKAFNYFPEESFTDVEDFLKNTDEDTKKRVLFVAHQIYNREYKTTT